MSENEAANLLEEPESILKDDRIDPSNLNLEEEVIQLNRVAKVVKGGRRFSFSALVVVGDRDGHVGVGFGKANEVPEAIQKAVQNGKKNLIYVPRINRTLPYSIIGAYNSARVMIRPASEGTGLIAGPAVRTVFDLAGVQDVLTKSLGSSNVLNILKATVAGLSKLLDGEDVARLRGKSLEEMIGSKRAERLRESRERAQARVDGGQPTQRGRMASKRDQASERNKINRGPQEDSSDGSGLEDSTPASTVDSAPPQTESQSTASQVDDSGSQEL